MEKPTASLNSVRLRLPTLWKVIGGLLLAALLIGTVSILIDEVKPLLLVALVSFIAALLSVGVVLTALVGLATRPEQRGYFGISVLGGIVVAMISAAASFLGLLSQVSISPWGRPLRIRGKQVHPKLRPGSDWAAGSEPRCDDLEPATRDALATLWHHDAQKEHASVPAFSRLAWLLAGLGAPPELLEETHRAGMQEIDHARRCFAIAAGYAGAALSVEAMPEILQSALGVGRNALRAVALESLCDGCLIEDFNADVARIAAEHARDPAALELTSIIARDEREHAELAWKILEWCIAIGGPKLHLAIARAADKLPPEGPRAYADDEIELVRAASSEAMIAHGRVPAERWAAIYSRRLKLTRTRVHRLLDQAREHASAKAA